MGWICPQCGSENLYSDRSCAACLKKKGSVWRLRQRVVQARLKRCPYEAVGARQNAPLSGVQRLCGQLLRLYPMLVAICFLCIALVGLQPQGRARWSQQMEQFARQAAWVVSTAAGEAQRNAAQLMESREGFSRAARRFETAGVKIDARFHAALAASQGDLAVAMRRLEAAGERISSMRHALEDFRQKSEQAVYIVRKMISSL